MKKTTKSCPFKNEHKGIDGSRITIYRGPYFKLLPATGSFIITGSTNDHATGEYAGRTNHIWLNPIYLEDDDEWISGLISHEFLHMLFHNLEMLIPFVSLDNLYDKGKYKHGIDYDGIGSFRKDRD